MDEILKRIKRAVLAGHFKVTDKADVEIERDGLTYTDVQESIYQAVRIHKTIRSTSAFTIRQREYLHIIISPNFDGTLIYTKGKLVNRSGIDVFYVFVSAKAAE